MKYALGVSMSREQEPDDTHNYSPVIIMESPDPVAVITKRNSKEREIKGDTVAFAIDEDAPSPITWDYAIQHEIQLAVAYVMPENKASVARPAIVVGLRSVDEVWKEVRQLIKDGYNEAVPMVWQPAIDGQKAITWEDVEVAKIPWGQIN